MRRPLSLKGRAIMLLSQREHSRLELRRKLLPMARAEARAAGGDEDDTAGLAGAQVDTLLDWLQAHQYLSEERFLESRLHARASRYGNRRIERELGEHGVPLSPQARLQLKETELARAQEVWRRKYGRAAADAAERARQMRFLIARGFSSEVVRRVVRSEPDD